MIAAIILGLLIMAGGALVLREARRALDEQRNGTGR
jgi:hypothetical protein